MSAEHLDPAPLARRTCPICWEIFPAATARHTYCSARCRKTAHQRRQAGQPAPASLNRPTDTERGTARPRLLASPEPAALRSCPHCGETITIVALLTTPEAAQPTQPVINTAVIPLRR